MSGRYKPKYQFPRARKKRGGGFGWVIVLIVLVLGFYFIWHHRPAKKPSPAPTPAVAKRLPPPLVISQQAPADFPRPVHDVLEAQVALARRGISSGAIDAALGWQTREAITVFQQTQNLPLTGKLDADTRTKLTLDSPILTNYLVTADDLASLQPLGKTWLEKSQQSEMAYENELDLVAEKSHSHPLLIKALNPKVDWTNVPAGTILQIPDVNYPDPDTQAAFIIIHLSENFLEAFDGDTNLLVHFPCSIAAKVEKRPVGLLHVVAIIPHPNYTVDPELFPESPELAMLGHKLILPPGPRNPVGVAWIGLDKTGYGIHGTPNPEQVGRTESHGCFRLANWDAEYLLKLVWMGMPMIVQE